MDFDKLMIVPEPEITGKNVLPVVLAADNNYAPYAGTAICSMLEHSSPDDYYDIVILDDGISETNRNKILSLLTAYNNSQIRFLDLKHFIPDVPTGLHFSKASYLRLFVPFLFREYDKVLYLDSDLVCLENVAALFETEMTDEYVGGVRSLWTIQRLLDGDTVKLKGKEIPIRDYFTDVLHFDEDDFEKYINTGILLYNIKAFSSENFKVLNDLKSYLYFGYKLVDQCIINILFKNRIKYLHPKWNVMIPNKKCPDSSEELTTQLSEAIEKPAILHYITNQKPWKLIEHEKSDIYWQYCKKTPWYREQQEQLLTPKYHSWLNKSEIVFQKLTNHCPQVSIIMPIYNQGDTIEKTIKSILLQNFTDFELIIVNDCSTDDSCGIIEKYLKLDSRIKMLDMPSNQGSGPARNSGMDHARGQYIRFCDADDFYPPEVLNIMMAKTESEQFDIVVGNMALWDNKNKEINFARDSSFITEEVFTDSFEDVAQLWRPFHYHRVLFRKQFLMDEGIRFPALLRGQDIVFLADALVKASRISTIQEPSYIFNLRFRNRHFTFEQARDILQSRLMTTEKLRNAGHHKIAMLNVLLFPSMHFDITDFPHEQALKLASLMLKVYEWIPQKDIIEDEFLPFKVNIDAAVNLLRQLHNSTPEFLLRNLINSSYIFDLMIVTDKENNNIQVCENRKLQLEINRIKNSGFWKITRPLRILKMLVFEHQNFGEKLKHKLDIKV